MPSRLARGLRRCLVATLVTATAGGVATATAVPAAAHNVLVASSPEADAELDTAPDEVVLEFNDEVQSGGNGIVVTGPDGDDHTTGSVAIDGVEASIGLARLEEPGTYTVDYRIISADGHPLEDDFEFTLTATATPGSQESPQQQDDDAGAAQDDPATAADSEATQQNQQSNPLGMPLWVAALLAVALIGVIVALIIQLRRGGGSQDDGES